MEKEMRSSKDIKYIGEDEYTREVIAKHQLRSIQGKREHGDQWDRHDIIRFLEDAQEEAMDLSIYLERALEKARELLSDKEEG